MAGNSRAGAPAADGRDHFNMRAGTGCSRVPTHLPYRGAAQAGVSGKGLTLPAAGRARQTTTPYASVKAFLAYAVLA